ncbi:MAG: hypothetical protein HQK98_08755 [Nitrospirae bacterium]|nr:hypothetical protein [Nitrospirota bacterium]
MIGYLKIGYTQRTARDRAWELYKDARDYFTSPNTLDSKSIALGLVNKNKKARIIKYRRTFASNNSKSALVAKPSTLVSCAALRASDNPFACSSEKPEDFSASNAFNVSNSTVAMAQSPTLHSNITPDLFQYARINGVTAK